MSFFSFLGDLVELITNEAQDKMNEVEKEKKRMNYYSDEKIIREYQNSKGCKKVAAGMLLKEKGYGEEKNK